VSRYKVVALACVAAAVALYPVVIAFPAESGKPWGGIAAAAMVAVIIVGIASALLARRPR
jgi:hypothetical protein